VRGHRQALLVEHVLAVHQERRLAVEGLAVELAVVGGEGLAHRLQDVLLVIGRVLGDVAVHLVQPAVAGVDRYLVVGQRGDVVLPGLVGEVLADLVADVVLGQDREVDLDARLLGEVGAGQLLQLDHLRVVDHEDVDGVAAGTGPARADPAAGEQRGEQRPCGGQGERGSRWPSSALGSHGSLLDVWGDKGHHKACGRPGRSWGRCVVRPG
jgi:hypothetical protein